MPRYRYRAVAPDGAIEQGELDAASREELVLRLRQQQKVTLSAEAPSESSSARTAATGRRRRGAAGRDRALLVRELATLLGAGLPVERALALAGELGRGRAATAARVAATRVRGGQPLSAALAESELGFAPAAVAMLRSGEASGGLLPALEALADYLERADEARTEVRSALVYPVILLVFAGLSLLYMLVFVVPQFEALFRDAGRSAPLATRLLAALSEGIGTWGLPVLLAGLLALLGFRRWRRGAAAGLAVDRWLLRLPVAGRLVASLEAERYLRTLAALLRGGVTLAEAAELAAAALGNRAMTALAAAAAQAVRTGAPFAPGLLAEPGFPATAVELLRVGEASGGLALMSQRAAEMQGRQARALARRLAALAVPIVTLLLGCLVGAIVWALISSVVGLYELA
ncbi:MAG: type II secretion system F family protein [Alphaproteobacteria bacterium]|nr:type II secretion system F family protein [Alphaproteobacteria bacterium]